MKRPLYQFFALCLALLWMPATAHCRLEALGLDFAACSEGCHGESSASESEGTACNDACDLVENGYYKSCVAAVKVPLPSAALCACLFCLHVPEPGPDTGLFVAPAAAERPQEWVTQWQFVRRAAAPARAPDSLIA